VPQGLQNGGWVDAFMHMQRYGINLKAGFFGLAGPVQIRRLHLLQGFQRGAHAVLIAAL
jgi:hypothetical protein